MFSFVVGVMVHHEMLLDCLVIQDKLIFRICGRNNQIKLLERKLSEMEELHKANFLKF